MGLPARRRRGREGLRPGGWEYRAGSPPLYPRGYGIPKPSFRQGSPEPSHREVNLPAGPQDLAENNFPTLWSAAAATPPFVTSGQTFACCRRTPKREIVLGHALSFGLPPAGTRPGRMLTPVYRPWHWIPAIPAGMMGTGTAERYRMHSHGDRGNDNNINKVLKLEAVGRKPRQ
jgi:hypothetical protein